MGHNFKEKSVFNIDRDKYESNYDKIFGNKKCQISESESEKKITITKSDLMDAIHKCESLMSGHVDVSDILKELGFNNE